jgi:hypothetical protein
MTTATTQRNDGTPIPGTPFGYGAGQVVPNSAADPGLVYDAGWNNWLAFLCGTTNGVGAGTCSSLTNAGYSTDPSGLNYPSISIGALAGQKTVKRTVKNVASSTSTYTVSVMAPAGIAVEVTPASITLAPGASASYTVTFTSTDSAILNEYAFGSLTWSDGKHKVTSPLVVRPVALAAPLQVSGSYNVTFGYNGTFTATPRGLVPAVTFDGNVVDDPADDIATALVTGVGITMHTVDIPAGTTYARFSLFDDFVDGQTDDLDLYVFNSAFAQVGGSGGGTAAEEVNLLNPVAGTYYVVVHGWQTDGPDANYRLFTWALGSTAAGNMTVSAPTTATVGQTGAINLTFTDLTSGVKYLGSIAYNGSPSMPNPTIVVVNP